MTEQEFAEWAASLVICDEEAFLPTEIDGVGIPAKKRALKRCHVCGDLYRLRRYREHAATTHTDPRRAADRERQRRKRAAA